MLQGQFGAQDLVALRVLQTDTGIVVPARAELIGESPVNFVAKRDLKPLDGTVQRFAERGVPHVETKCLRGVAGGNALVAQ